MNVLEIRRIARDVLGRFVFIEQMHTVGKKLDARMIDRLHNFHAVGQGIDEIRFIAADGLHHQRDVILLKQRNNFFCNDLFFLALADI